MTFLPPELFVVCTRIHSQLQSNINERLTRIRVMNFLASAIEISDNIVICVDTSKGNELFNIVNNVVDGFVTRSLDAIIRVDVLPLAKWGAFIPALNSCLKHVTSLASEMEAPRPEICYVSAEVATNLGEINCLRRNLTQNTLVVGAYFHGHEFEEGEHKITGANSPWNTLAVWDANKLAQTGFLKASEGRENFKNGGIEEVCCISNLQRLNPGTCKAKLIKSSNELKWSTKWGKSEKGRAKWHQEKMLSKISRATAQLKDLNLRPGTVIHINENRSQR